MPRQHPAATLNGKHPKVRAIELEHAVLSHIYRWGFSAAPIIRGVLGVETYRRVIGRLLDAKQIRCEPWAVVPARWFPLMLTPIGHERVLARWEREPHAYPEDPVRTFRERLARHHYACQLHALAYQGSRNLYVQPDHFWAPPAEHGKRPDMIVEYASGGRKAIEIELSPKFGRELDQALVGHLRAVKEGRYTCVGYYSPSQALLDRYRQTLADPEGLRIWARDARGTWGCAKRVVIPKTVQVDSIYFMAWPVPAKDLW